MKLTLQERATLKVEHKEERDKRRCDRIKAVLAYDDGYSYAEIARLLLLDDTTIRRHVEDYLMSDKLLPENGGSVSKLTKLDNAQLILHLNNQTYLYVKDVCVYVKKNFGKKYSVSGMTKWLWANNFRYKKPHGIPAKANKEQQEMFISTYKALKREVAKDNSAIYFVDSVHPQHQTHLAYGWIQRGVRKELPMTGRQRRMNIIGGFCLNGNKCVFDEHDRINSDNIQHFMKKLRQKNLDKKKIHLIWDNAAYHRSDGVKKLAKKLWIILHYLPPYSPNLNPIERLWKNMHQAVTYNTYYQTFDDFRQATLEFLKNISRKKKLLASRITDNFQIIQSSYPAS